MRQVPERVTGSTLNIFQYLYLVYFGVSGVSGRPSGGRMGWGLVEVLGGRSVRTWVGTRGIETAVSGGGTGPSSSLFLFLS